jgi:hypothetical protein
MQRTEVAQAMVVLLERGERITTRTIRDVIGHGSLRDISAHLRDLTAGESAVEETGAQDEPVPPADMRPPVVPPGAHTLATSGVVPHEHTQHTQAEEPEPLTVVGARLQQLYDGRMDVREIVAAEVARGTVPPLGAAEWSVRLVDRLLVMYAGLRRGLEG